MRMPSMSGLALARSIRGDPALSGTGVVLLTSLGGPVSQRELDEAGVVARIAKPVRHAQLREAVAAALRGDGARGEAPGSRTPAGEAAAGPRLRVLVAEDNVVNQQVATLQLQKLGHVPVVVGNGGEAVAAVKATPYDLVLMDCQMPGIDGYEATRRIRRWEDERRARGERFVPVPVVAMTANAMLGDRDACFSAGMNDYVAKPMTSADLVAALSRVAAATR
jgi:CheY-like chemotaxis protein